MGDVDRVLKVPDDSRSLAFEDREKSFLEIILSIPTVTPGRIATTDSTNARVERKAQLTYLGARSGSQGPNRFVFLPVQFAPIFAGPDSR
jgi:hypothetical protein